MEPDTKELDQEGGALLGKGLYGCVFDEPLKCKSGTEKTFIKRKKNIPSQNHAQKKTTQTYDVGKVTKSEDANVEIHMTELLSEYVDADKYFILVKRSCIPEPRYKQTTKEKEDIVNCKLLENVPLNSTKQLVFPFGGKTLHSIKYTPQTIHYFSFCQHILEAATRLLIMEVVHNDLHMNNILYTDPNSSKLIDFGLSWQPKALTLSNIYDLYREFNPDIKQEPPEVSYINGIINNVDKKIILAMIRDKKLGFYYMRKLIGIPIEKQLDDLIKFINTSWSFEEKNWHVFYSLYWSKIDAWALGVLFAQIYLDLSVYKEFELSDAYNKRNIYMLTAIRGLCEADPGKRLDAAEALVIWNPDSPLLKEPDVQTWFLKQKKEREELNKIRL